jgi:hypothetical protein
MKNYENCICCNKAGELTISLSPGSNLRKNDNNDPDDLNTENLTPRWYLPPDRHRKSTVPDETITEC